MQAPESPAFSSLSSRPSSSLLRTSFVFGIADWKVLCARDFFSADKSSLGKSRTAKNKTLKNFLLFWQLNFLKYTHIFAGI